MIHLLRQLGDAGVRYLLISGQATVVYGAAEFTEDIDLWVDPAPQNLEPFLRALARMNATVGRLTPPVTEENARFGHGFHFVVPEPEGLTWQVDIMGQPPRVGSFRTALERSLPELRAIPQCRVIDPLSLVQLKKTCRERDYPIIAALIERVVEGWARGGEWTLERIRWVLDEARSLHALRALSEQVDLAHHPGETSRLCVKALWDPLLEKRPPSESEFESFQAALDAERRDLQRADREYWTRITASLRELRQQGRLLPEGVSVSELLR